MTTHYPPEVFSDGAGKTASIYVWTPTGAKQMDARWGLRPFDTGGHSYNLLRSEDRRIERPCLAIVNNFFVQPDDSAKRYRVNLITNEPFFCVAGMWQPETSDWPDAFAALTVPANPDIASLKDRHMAVVRPDDWEAWLRQTKPVEEILRPFPRGSFNVVAPGRKRSGELFGF